MNMVRRTNLGRVREPFSHYGTCILNVISRAVWPTNSHELSKYESVVSTWGHQFVIWVMDFGAISGLGLGRDWAGLLGEARLRGRRHLSFPAIGRIVLSLRRNGTIARSSRCQQRQRDGATQEGEANKKTERSRKPAEGVLLCDGRPDDAPN